jgi:thioredoxin-related protein
MIEAFADLLDLLFRARRVRLALALLALAFSAPALAALFGVEAVDLQAEIRAAGREGRRLVIFFELPGCPECLKMKRHVFQDPGVEKEFERRYLTRRIDLASTVPIADARARRRAPAELAGQWRIFAAPSFVFLDADGNVEYRHTGSLTRPADFSLLGRFVSEAIYEEQPFSDYLHANSHAGNTQDRISGAAARETGDKHGEHEKP